jgi:hypothetical protein
MERSFSWLGQNRRMSNVYERLCATGEAFIYAAMTRLMVRRLVRAYDLLDSFSTPFVNKGGRMKGRIDGEQAKAKRELGDCF